MNTCESCGARQGKWYVVDDNAEVTLCGPCVKVIRTEATVEKIDG